MVVLERDGSIVRNTKATHLYNDGARKRKARSSGWLGRFLHSMRRQNSQAAIYR